MVVRTHSETVLPLAFATDSSLFCSSRLRRTCTLPALAEPMGSFGRPGFFVAALGCLGISELLNGGGSYCGFMGNI
jgi:hypothetical protein